MTEEKETVGQENEKQKENRDSIFVICGLSDSTTIVGLTTEGLYKQWITTKAPIHIVNPRKLAMIPVEEGNQITGFNVVPQPVHPLMSKQENIPIDPTFIDVLGNVVFDDGGNEYQFKPNGGSDVTKFFNSYQNAIEAWRHEISGLVKPTQDDIISTSKSQNDKIVPLKK